MATHGGVQTVRASSEGIRMRCEAGERGAWTPASGLLVVAGTVCFAADAHGAGAHTALAGCHRIAALSRCLTELLPGAASPYLAAGGRGALAGFSLAFAIALARWGLRRDAPTARATLREAIPAGVRHEVWRRDGGACVECGSRERLEFDHIVAVSRGGSNTARNLDLRCEPCNRRKGGSI